MNITTPDIGVDKALVSEILVNVGDQISENDSILVLESDKASVEVPSPATGVVKAILVSLNDEVSEGKVLIELETETSSESAPETVNEPAQTTEPEQITTETEKVIEKEAAATGTTTEIEVKVPDIGVEKALIAEILVKVGDQINIDDSIVVVESDKASVEIPSPLAGEVTAISVKSGDVVKEGVILLSIKSESSSHQKDVTPKDTQTEQKSGTVTNSAPHSNKHNESSAEKIQSSDQKAQSFDQLTDQQHADNAKVYAGPAVRQLARELGVVLADVKASGAHSRIVKDDVFAYVKTRLTHKSDTQQTTLSNHAGLPPLPDFTAFGGGESKVMTRLQQVSVPQLSLNNFIPQVTQFDLSDITELEAWRSELKDGFKKQNISLTILAFIAKVTAHLLREEPYFFGHLSDDQKSVFLRHEIHMGIAVATPDGLTVPVLRHPDQKSIKQIAVELAELSQKARDKKLSPKDLQGANFTITSLGSIGGTAFTPLVNWPQVAILGISPAKIQPVWNGKEFEPRLMLPLSLSYDHRVINGADAARFTHKLSSLLKDIRNILL